VIAAPRLLVASSAAARLVAGSGLGGAAGLSEHASASVVASASVSDELLGRRDDKPLVRLRAGGRVVALRDDKRVIDIAR